MTLSISRHPFVSTYPSIPCSAPPRRSVRHPSSSEEGSSFAGSPPDSGGAAASAGGWLQWRAERRGGYPRGALFRSLFSPPFQTRVEKSRLSRGDDFDASTNLAEVRDSAG
jgi:hypothetical protein